MNEKKQLWVPIIIAIALIAMNIEKEGTSQFAEGEWSLNTEGYEQFLVEESDFDFSHPEVFKVAKEIKQSTSSVEDAIKKTIKYVVTNVRYDSQVSVLYCYNEKASDVLLSGRGDCVSMSRLVTSLLRAQGIPARTSGGCVSFAQRCAPVFAAVPLLETQTVEMEEGDFKKRGYLHEWVEVYTPEKGWRLIEATAGKLYPADCGAYLQYAYDTNQYDRCVITDSSFWNECRTY